MERQQILTQAQEDLDEIQKLTTREIEILRFEAGWDAEREAQRYDQNEQSGY